MLKEIEVALGITKNIGNYESFRIDVGAKYVLPDGADIDAAWKDVWNEIDEQLTKKVSELTEALDE